jgi:hypothetical protein
VPELNTSVFIIPRAIVRGRVEQQVLDFVVVREAR